MTIDLEGPELGPLVGGLHETGRAALLAAGVEAARVHADEVGPEHLLRVLMVDEESAACRAVLHAFADPETLAQEALSIMEGILVVGSSCSLPLSTRSVSALQSARARAAEIGAITFDGDQILAAAAGALDDDLAGLLKKNGFDGSRLGPRDEGGGVRETGHLFRDSTEDARRTLTLAARLASAEESPSIAPGHLVIAALTQDSGRAHRAGLSATRAKQILAGRAGDDSPPDPNPLPPSNELVDLVRHLEPGADTFGVLAAFHRSGGEELAHLLGRHRITAAFLERTRAAFRDDDPT